MTNEEIQASPELRKFFDNLLDLKADVKYHAEKTGQAFSQEVYSKLDTIIKEAK